jgi:hypothetical protein
MANVWTDPAFRYHASESHDNASHFRRRMRERVRTAMAQMPAKRVRIAASKRKAAP